MSENIQLTYAQKKYLFAIYKLGHNGGVVKSSEVAKLVGVTKASTAIMTESGSAEVSAKEPLSEFVIRQTVFGIGYSVEEIKQNEL